MRLQLKTEKKRRRAAERGLCRAENRCRGLKAILAMFKSTKPLHADEIKQDERMRPARATGVLQTVHDPQS